MDINIQKAQILRISDGDTVVCNIRWLDLTKTCRVRMASMYAPELTEAGGVESRNYLASILTPQLQIFVQCHIVDKFARPLGTVYLSQKVTKSVNQMMVDAGHAKPLNIKTQIAQIKRGLLL